MRSFLNLLLSLLTLTLFGCPVDLSPGVLQPDDDDATSDDDDSTVADDDDATPTDDDDSTVADDDDATPVDNDVDGDGIPTPPDRLWVGPHDLCWAETDLDHLEAAYLQGHNLGYAEPPATDWAQQYNEIVCDSTGWCCPDYDLIPEGTLRVSASDGTPESLNSGALWRTTGPSYCANWPDPGCWDNTPYGGQGWANCVDHWYDADGDHRFAPSSGCADTY